jgi:hypothetical protein
LVLFSDFLYISVTTLQGNMTQRPRTFCPRTFFLRFFVSWTISLMDDMTLICSVHFLTTLSKTTGTEYSVNSTYRLRDYKDSRKKWARYGTYRDASLLQQSFSVNITAPSRSSCPSQYEIFSTIFCSLPVARLSPYVFIDTFKLELLPYKFELLCPIFSSWHTYCTVYR